MPSTERTPKVKQGEVSSQVNPSVKEVPFINNNISEIGGKRIETPVSWDSGCRL